MYDVAFSGCRDYTPEACHAALETVLAGLGGLDWVRPGMRIGIKVNLVSALKPEAAGTTHPVLLCELVKLLAARGAQPIVGDSPGGLYNAAYLSHVYAATGMHAVEDCGGRLNQDFSTFEAHFPEAVIARNFTATAWLRDCDAMINFCKLKSHGMMSMSNAAKNLFGTIPGTMKPEYHFRFPKQEDFANMLVDLDEYWKPQLHLCDAVVAMEGNGPTAGTPKPVGLVLGAQNPHKLDLLCAELIGYSRDQVLTLEAAVSRGLCPESVRELTVNADWTPYRCRDFELIVERRSLQFGGKGGRLGRAVTGVLRKCLETHPQVASKECIGCQKCAQICPVKAITMKNRLPQIDRSKCIRCFCCQEFCPKGAMKVRRRAIARVLTRSAGRS